MTGVWVTNDTISATRMNEKTIFQGTGAAISGLAVTYAGMLAFCTTSGSGFVAESLYKRNAANSAWGAVGVDEKPYLLLSTTIGDYTTPTGVTGSSDNLSAPDITDDCSSDNFTDNDSGVMGVSGGVLVFDFATISGIDSTVRDCTSMSDTTFEFRCKLVLNTIDAGNVARRGFIGLSDAIQTASCATSMDAIGLAIIGADAGKEFRAIACNGAAPDTPTVTSTFTLVPVAGTTYYLRIRRTSATSTTIGLYSDSGYNLLLEEEVLTISASYTGLRYIGFYDASTDESGTHTTGTADDFKLWKTTNPVSSFPFDNLKDGNVSTKWKSASEANPFALIDLGSTREIVGLSIHLDRTDTTITSLKIRFGNSITSWSDSDNFAYVNVTDFTDDTWRFLANNFTSTNFRYIQIYANETGVLAINEIKIRYGVTDAVKLLGHKHRTRTVDSVDSFTDSN